MGPIALSALALALSPAVSAHEAVTSSVLASVAASCPAATSAVAAPDQERAALRCGVNVVRRRFHSSELRNAVALDRSALLKAVAIRRCGFTHTPCGTSFSQTFARTGYLRRSGVVGESLAWGQSSLGSPVQTLVAWLASPPHRANLLSQRWVDAGIAFERGRMFGRDGVSLWVLEFGRRG